MAALTILLVLTGLAFAGNGLYNYIRGMKIHFDSILEDADRY